MNIFGQLINAQVENKTSNYSGGVSGRIWWNSTAGKIYSDDGTLVRALLRNDGFAVLGNSGTAANNIRLHRGASGVLQFVSGADATAEGTLSTALNQISAKHENYTNAGKPAVGNPGRVIFVSDFLGGTLLMDDGASWKSIGGGSGTTVSNEAEFAAAITAFGIAGGGEMTIVQSFSLTTNYTIPARTIIVGASKVIQLSIQVGCTLTMGDYADLRDIALVAVKTTGNLIEIPAVGATFQGVEFVMVGANSVTALYFTGTGNHVFRCVFQNVVGTSATGINYFSGSDNTDDRCIFT